jgi:16S rRNA processing protein RimM
MNKSTSFIIGEVTGVHGLGGNLRVRSFAQSADTFSAGRIVLLQSKSGQGNEYKIISASEHKKGLLLSLEGVNNRDDAQTLVGYQILIDREQLPEPEENEWYWQDLIGLDVVDEIKGPIGTITDIFPTGANDILVVKRADKETLVPMNRHFVTLVDMDEKVLKTSLPEDYE